MTATEKLSVVTKTERACAPQDPSIWGGCCRAESLPPCSGARRRGECVPVFRRVQICMRKHVCRISALHEEENFYLRPDKNDF